jgi:hypothetical protein
MKLGLRLEPKKAKKNKKPMLKLRILNGKKSKIKQQTLSNSEFLIFAPVAGIYG